MKFVGLVLIFAGSYIGYELGIKGTKPKDALTQIQQFFQSPGGTSGGK